MTTAILTKYLPVTNTKPSRIQASFGKGGEKICLTCANLNDGDDRQKHFQVAEALCHKMGLHGVMISAWVSNSEMVFTFYTYSSHPLQQPIHEHRFIVEQSPLKAEVINKDHPLFGQTVEVLPSATKFFIRQSVGNFEPVNKEDCKLLK